MDQLKPRQLDIMQNLAKMLGEKGPVKITTSLLANQCGITEAAIYRHFPSKKKIYSGLVDFCEQNIFDLIANINSSEGDELEKAKKILILLVNFSEKNPGLARLLTREAFSIEETSLDERIGQMMAKVELLIKQNLFMKMFFTHHVTCTPIDQSSTIKMPHFCTCEKGSIIE